MAYKTVSQIAIDGKRLLLRLDLNVPVKEGRVTDMTRIDAVLPIIKYAMEHKAKVILCSHLGRPDGKRVPEDSLKPVAEVLSRILRVPVPLAPDCVGKDVKAMVAKMRDGDVIMLENLRFHEEEEANDPEFSKELASLADVYVNDAFAAAHRAHASLHGVPMLMKQHGKPVAAGFLMDEELKLWDPIVKGSGKSVAIVGGAKLKEKMEAVDKFSKKFDRVILGGVVANVFMKAQGIDIGDSRYLEKDKDYTQKAKEILEKDAAHKIALPKKVILATPKFERKGEAEAKSIEKGLIFADILPTGEDLQTIRDAQRIVWFGPMGAYEFGFRDGSRAVVDAIARSHGICVIGGGDLAEAARGVKAKISTGGGASIQYITTGKLEALEALE